MQEYSRYIIHGKDGKPLPTIIDFIISYSTEFCRTHPEATVADAGDAVFAAEKVAIQKVIARAKQNASQPPQ